MLKGDKMKVSRKRFCHKISIKGAGSNIGEGNTSRSPPASSCIEMRRKKEKPLLSTGKVYFDYKKHSSVLICGNCGSRTIFRRINRSYRVKNIRCAKCKFLHHISNLEIINR